MVEMKERSWMSDVSSFWSVTGLKLQLRVGESAFYITWLTSTDSLSGDLRSKLMTYHGERNGFLSSQQLYRDIDCESAIFFVDPVKIDASLLLEDSVSLSFCVVTDSSRCFEKLLLHQPIAVMMRTALVYSVTTIANLFIIVHALVERRYNTIPIVSHRMSSDLLLQHHAALACPKYAISNSDTSDGGDKIMPSLIIFDLDGCLWRPGRFLVR